jgi:hypothetical protein
VTNLSRSYTENYVCSSVALLITLSTISYPFTLRKTSSMVQWSEFLATYPKVPGSIPGATRFSEKWWVWNGVHSAF